MKNHDGFLQGYNGQILVNEDQYILSFDLTSAQNDVHQLHPLISKFMNTLGAVSSQKPHCIIGDAGYFSYDNVIGGSALWPDLLIATSRERDCYQHSDLDGSLLFIEGIWKSIRQSEMPGYSLLRAVARCVIDTLGWMDENVASPPECAKMIMEALVRSPTGSAIYRKRKIMPEPIFGRMKEILRFKKFYRRGIDACSADWALLCSTMNILKARGQIGKVRLSKYVKIPFGRDARMNSLVALSHSGAVVLD